MSVNSMYGFNPYMMSQASGLNDDFMAGATGLNNQYAQLAQQQALMQQLALQQPTGDTFQKSEGGSGLSTGLQFAAIGGVGAGAGAYFLGDKLGAALTKDGKTFSDDILKAFQGDYKEIAEAKALEMFKTSKVNRIKASGFASVDEFNAVKEYLAAKDPSKLSAEIKSKLPADFARNIDSYKQKYTDAIIKLDKLNSDKSIKIISDRASNLIKSENLACQIENVTNLAARKTLLEGLAKDATPAQIEELIAKNPGAFGITKTAEAEIAQEAKKIAQQLGTDKTSAVKTITNEITNVETKIGGLRKTLNDTVATHWDDTAKAFKESAPSQLKNAAKNFKWSKAGKYGAIAAGVGLVLGWMFGGNKS